MDGSAGKLLSIIHRNLCSFMDRSFGDCDIGHGPRRFLVEIALFPEHTQEEISERLLMDKTTTARALKQLELRGYITRTRDPDDRRRYRLRTTTKGDEMIPPVLEAREIAQKALYEGLTEEELSVASKILRKMADNAVNLRKGRFSRLPEKQDSQPTGKSGK
jgi:DNA-binding MarR family transcriptional regulator